MLIGQVGGSRSLEKLMTRTTRKVKLAPSTYQARHLHTLGQQAKPLQEEAIYG